MIYRFAAWFPLTYFQYRILPIKGQISIIRNFIFHSILLHLIIEFRFLNLLLLFPNYLYCLYYLSDFNLTTMLGAYSCFSSFFQKLFDPAIVITALPNFAINCFHILIILGFVRIFGLLIIFILIIIHLNCCCCCYFRKSCLLNFHFLFFLSVALRAVLHSHLTVSSYYFLYLIFPFAQKPIFHQVFVFRFQVIFFCL